MLYSTCTLMVKKKCFSLRKSFPGRSTSALYRRLKSGSPVRSRKIQPLNRNSESSTQKHRYRSTRRLRTGAPSFLLKAACSIAINERETALKGPRANFWLYIRKHFSYIADADRDWHPACHCGWIPGQGRLVKRFMSGNHRTGT